MKAKQPKPDCTSCGACCVSPNDQPSFCDLTSAELESLSPQFIAKNVEITSTFKHLLHGGHRPPDALRTRWKTMKSGPFKGFELCVCCMLDGSVMRKVHCRIYETRPSICRKALKPGDRMCLMLRKALSDEKAKALKGI